MIGPFSSIEQQIDFFFPYETHPYRILEKKVAQQVAPDSRVLEIGCGRSAPSLQRLRGKARALYGIDLVSFTVDDPDLTLLNENVTFMQSFADADIDLAFSRSVMEHVEDAESAYAEIFRVLKPGGRYLFLTPNRYDYASIIAAIVPNRFHGRIVRRTEGRKESDTFPTFYNSNSFTQIRKLAAATGFEVGELMRLGQYPAYLQFSRSLFWLGCLYEKGLEKAEALDCLKGWIFCELQKPAR